MGGIDVRINPEVIIAIDVAIQIDIPDAVAEDNAALRDVRVDDEVIIAIDVAVEVDVADVGVQLRQAMLTAPANYFTATQVKLINALIATSDRDSAARLLNIKRAGSSGLLRIRLRSMTGRTDGLSARPLFHHARTCTVPSSEVPAAAGQAARPAQHDSEGIRR